VILDPKGIVLERAAAVVVIVIVVVIGDTVLMGVIGIQAQQVILEAVRTKGAGVVGHVRCVRPSAHASSS